MKKPYQKPQKELSHDFEELKAYMDYCTDVYHWNQKREVAKHWFSPPTICMLDASGFINKAIGYSNLQEEMEEVKEVL